MIWIDVGIAAVAVGLLMVAGHYFNWPKPLSRVTAYVCGVGGIGLGFSYVCLRHGWYMPLAAFWIVTAVAGFATKQCYDYDEKHNLRIRTRIAEQNQDVTD